MPSDCVGVFPFFLFLRGEGGQKKARATPKQASFRSIFPIGHLHDDVTLLPRPESFRMLFSCANQGFCYLNLAGITEFKYKRTNEKDSGHSSQMTPSCIWPIFQPVSPSFYMGVPRGRGGGGGGIRCASSSIDHRTLETLVSESLLEGERPNVFYFSLKIFQN